MEPPGRRDLCARCRAAVLICSRCDRGPRYCAGGCAEVARTGSLRAAGQRYQASPRGRHAHAARQRRYRMRQAKVTHHGSPPPPPPALLPPHPKASEPGAPAPWHCHFCGRALVEQVARGNDQEPKVPQDSGIAAGLAQRDARGAQKGRVERAIRYVRDGFFAARPFADLRDLNGQADDRLCPQDKTMAVRDAVAQEQPRVLALPANPWPLEERAAVSVGKTPYVRFDLNDYTVPHTLVRKTLTILADPERVRILDGQAVVATHPRSYDRGQQIENPAPLAALGERKAQAHAQRGMTWLAQAVPGSRTLLTQAAERGENLGAIIAALGRLVQRYGAAEVETAVRAALARGVPHPMRCVWP